MLLTVLLNIVLTATTFYGQPAGFSKGEAPCMATSAALQTTAERCARPPPPGARPVLPPATAQEALNTAFSALVILELGAKLAAMGPRLYWRSNWHKLDVLLSAAALVDIVTQARSGGGVQVGASGLHATLLSSAVPALPCRSSTPPRTPPCRWAPSRKC